MLHRNSLDSDYVSTEMLSVLTVKQDERFRPYPHPGEEFIHRKSRKHPTRYQVSQKGTGRNVVLAVNKSREQHTVGSTSGGCDGALS